MAIGLQYGAICEKCPGPDKCKDLPTAAEPIADESIDLTLTECPLKYVTEDVWNVIELADLYKKGLPPVAGGSLDQSCGFIKACRIIFQEQAYWKRKFSFNGSAES